MHFNTIENNLHKYKRSQITLFVILAIAIIAILIILFLPDIKKIITGPIPEAEIGSCLREGVEEGLDMALMHGGSVNPEAYVLFDNEKVEYLCYTSEWYQKCVMQKPMLLQSIEAEVEVYSREKVSNCLDEVTEDLRRRGYDVDISGNNTFDLEIVPDSIISKLNIDITLTKGEAVTRINIPRSDFDSDSYKMIMIASSILNFEAHYGDSNIDPFMAFYPDIKVEKMKQSEGTTIYRLTSRDTGEVMQFASRSVPWPPGLVYLNE